MSRTERLIAMEQLLFHSEAGMRAVELAEACGVDRRTVYRDLTLLNDFGVPIFQKSGRFHLNRKHYLANVRLSFDEMLALVLAASALSRRSVVPHLTSALQKLSRSLPHSIRIHSNSLVEFALLHKMDSAQVKVLDTLARGWSDLVEVKILYASRDGVKTRSRTLATYCIQSGASGNLYAIGLDSLTQKVRAFQLRRIRRARLLSTPYQIPAQFSLSRWSLTRARLDI
jgi:proteasome accessory factor B